MKPISFTPEVLRAKLAVLDATGLAQTRRPLKPQPRGVVYADRFPPRAEVVIGGCGSGWVDLLPQHNAGDLLWVRERARVIDWRNHTRATLRYELDGQEVKDVPWPSRLKAPRVGSCIPNGCHCEGARHFLEVVDVRVQRVQEISEADALAEGVFMGNDLDRTVYTDTLEPVTPRDAFRLLISSLYPGAWDENWWFWAYTLKRATSPEPVR